MTTKIKFNTVERDRLFFDQYEYSLCFRLSDCGVLRECSEAGVLRAVEWRNTTRRQWGRNPQITEEDTVNLLDMWRILNSHKGTVKYTCSFNLVYLYGNDPALLSSIAEQSYTKVAYGQHAVVTRPRDVVLKTDPKFKLRSYFKDRSLEPHEQTMLRNFLTSRPESYGITRGFLSHLHRPKWFFLQRHQWIEHNDPADVTMLSLVLPGIIRKTVPVQAK